MTLSEVVDETGIDATRLVVAEDLAKVLILTTFDRDDYLFDALRAGASGFLLKRTPPEDLLDGIRTIADLLRWVHFGLVTAEELGITSQNVAQAANDNAKNIDIANVRVVESGFGPGWRLPPSPIGLPSSWGSCRPFQGTREEGHEEILC